MSKSSLPEAAAPPPLSAFAAELGLKLRKTLQHHGREATVAARAALWDRFRWPAERPVFVLGCSRAGTLMLYKTLQLAPGLGALQRDLYAFWWQLHPPARKHWVTHAFGAADASAADRDAIARHFYAHTGHHRFMAKNNPHVLSIPYLQAMFPDAHFVYIKRDPGDNLASLISGWQQPERFGTWSADLPARVAVDGGRCTRWCFFLADGWREMLQAPLEQVCAFQYRAANEAALAARADVAPERWHEVFYEDFVNNAQGEFRRLFARLDLAFEPPILRHAAGTASRPSEPGTEIRLGKWRDGPHRERIERVLPGLDGLARRLGYPSAGGGW